MKKKSDVAKKRFIILVTLLAIFLVLTLLFNIWTYVSRPIWTQEVEVKFQVGNKFGILKDAERLEYGILMPGHGSTRFIDIVNNYSFPIEVKVLMSRELEGLVYGQRSTILKSGEEIQYAVSVKVPETAEYGNYSGYVMFEIYKA